MRCAEWLEAMLEAEPGELRGEGPSELATHVRGCLSCRRVAAAIIADTRALARVTHHEAHARIARRRAAIVGIAAAGIVLAITVRATGSSRGHSAPAASSAAVARPPLHVARAQPVAPIGASAAAASRPSIEPALPPRQHPTGSGIQPVAMQPTAFVAVPIPSRSADTAAARDDTPALSVRPHGGRRAAVFRVAETNVTVVWLY